MSTFMIIALGVCCLHGVFWGGREYEEIKEQLSRVGSFHPPCGTPRSNLATRPSSQCLYSLSLLARPTHSFKLRITSKMSVYTFVPQSTMGKQNLIRGGLRGKTDMSHPNALLPAFCFFPMELQH